MFACYKQLHPPTVVEHCTKANFSSETDLNLCVARCNQLEIYTLKKDTTTNKNKLALHSSYELFGNIESIASVRLLGHKKDALILSFLDAKVSVVEFDTATHNLKSVGLYYMEDDFLKEGCHQFVSRPRLRLEPRGRCAICLIYDTKLTIIPFKQQKSIIEEEQQKEELPVQRHKILDLKELGISNVKDYCFLYGYYEPTLLILHENEKTWSGRIALKRNTCTVTAVSLDLTREHYPIIWSVKALPMDCYRLIPLEEPLGGAIVVGMNQLVHINQRITYGLSVNDFCQAHDFPIDLEQYAASMFFDSVASTMLNNNHILFSMKNGELYVLHLFSDGRSLKGMKLAKASTSVPGSCMCTLTDDCFFLGSRLGDSLLIHFEEKQMEQKKNIEQDGPAKKKRKMEASNDDSFLAELDEEDFQILEDTSSKLAKGDVLTQYKLEVHDSLLNIGPISSFAIADVQPEDKKKRDRKYEILTCSGHGKNGCICVLHRSVPVEIYSQLKLDFKCERLWTLKYVPKEKNAKPEEIKDIFDAYLLISLKDSIKILAAGKGLDEISEGVEFITNEATLNVGNVGNYSQTVQICKYKIRLIEKLTKKHEIEVKKAIHASFILDPYVLLHFIDGSIALISIDPAKYKMSISYPKLSSGFGKVTAATLFTDTGGSDKLFHVEKDSNGLTFCLVYWSSGVFEIYTVPDFKCVFVSLKFSLLLDIVLDENPKAEDLEKFKSEEKDVIHYPYVQEMTLRRVSGKDENPHLVLLLSDDSLHIYQAYNYPTSSSKRLGNLRFKKMTSCDDYERDPYQYKKSRSHDLDLKSDYFFSRKQSPYQQRLIPFENVAGMAGIFQCGQIPRWIFSYRTQLRIQPLLEDYGVTTFTPFHNMGCAHSFIYYNEKEQFTIAELKNDGLTFHNVYWPTRKVPLRATPHNIIWSQSKNVYAVVTSRPIIYTPTMIEIDKLPEGRYPPMYEEKYSLKLLQAKSFSVMDNYEFGEHEEVLCMRTVNIIKDDSADDRDIVRNKYIPMMVVGTAITEGEDVQCRGKIFLFDFDQFGNQNIFKLDLKTSKELKGPVSDICELDGYLAVASGPKIYLFYYDWESGQLTPASFFDAQFYVTSMNSIKRYLFFGDRYKSAYFIRWRKNKGNALKLLSKDYFPLQVQTTGFIINDKELGLVVTDYNQNIQIYTFSPKSSESLSGKKLVPRADFHAGSFINTLYRLQMKDVKGRPIQHLSLWGTLDGSFGYLAPISESTYRRLSTLQYKMYTQLVHAAGLHPKAFRLMKPMTNTLHNIRKNIIDGQLVWKYLMLNRSEKKEFARQIGTSAEVILSNIFELETRTSYF